VDVLVRCEQLEADAQDLDRRVLLAAIRDDAARALALADSRVQEFAVTALLLVSGPSLMLLVAARTSITDAASAGAYLSRCRGLAGYLDQYVARLAAAAASGLQPVALLVEGAISQLRGHLAHPDRDPLLSHRRPEAGPGRRPGRRSWSGSCATRPARPWAAISTRSRSCFPGHGRPSAPGCCRCPVGPPPMAAASASAPP
jgi:uncharacterized protein (DUF885 family)